MARGLLPALLFACLLGASVHARHRDNAKKEGGESWADAAQKALFNALNAAHRAKGNSTKGKGPRAQAASPCQVLVKNGVSCVNYCWQDFTNWGSSGSKLGWVVETGREEFDGEGWRLHSWANGAGSYGSNTRMYLEGDSNWPVWFNTPRNPKTQIMAWFRGAPDSGKNSNVYLIENQSNNNGMQNGRLDEVDLVEMYGSTSKSELNVYTRGTSILPGSNPISYGIDNPGRRDYMYEMYLERGVNLTMWVRSPNMRINTWLSRQEFTSAKYRVPTNAMRLHAGIWDCSNYPSFCPGKFTGDASMVLKGLWIHNCF